MNTANVSAKTIASIVKLAATNPLSREYGEAIAQAWMEASAEPAAEAFKPGQVVLLINMPNSKRVVIVGVRSNGIWIRRTATDGERARRGVEQVKERVSIKMLTAA